MEALFKELLTVIKQKSHLRERIHLAETLQGAKELFIMACYADYFDAVGRHGYYGRLTDETVQGFYEFMKGQRL
jgi:hypothetical protein